MIKIIKQDYDKDGNETYREYSNGDWVKSEYDEKVMKHIMERVTAFG